MKFVLKKLTQKDLPQLLALFEMVLQEDFPEYKPRVAEIYHKHIYNDKYFKRFLRYKYNTIFGAFIGKGLIGFLSLAGQWGGVAEAHWMMIHKKYRRKGIATALLQKAEEWTLERKKHYLFLHTESNKNIEFYKKRGFEYIGLQKNAWFGVDEHLMQKVLKPQPFNEMFEEYLGK